MAGPVTLRYQVHQTLQFAIQFSAAAPGTGGGRVDCTGNLTTGRTATAYSPDPGVPALQPAFSTPGLVPAGPCPAGYVRVVAVELALSNWHQHVILADAGPDAMLQNASYTTIGPSWLRITVALERTLALHYHLIFQRELRP